MFGGEVPAFEKPRQKDTTFGIVNFKHIHARNPKNNAAGTFGPEVCTVGAPHQGPTIFGIVDFQHTHTR